MSEPTRLSVPPSAAAETVATSETGSVWNIVARFQQQAAKTPENVAVEIGSRAVGYRELNGIAEGIAGLLIAKENSQKPVAILMEEGPLLMAAIFAVLAHGRPFVPLETRLPESRLAAVLAASGASHVLADSAFFQIAKRIASSTVNVIEAETYSTNSVFKGFVPVPPKAPASIVYTSGSAGKPKGVIISHAQLSYGVTSRTRLFDVTASDRYAHVRSNGSSASINGQLLSLLNGATCCVFELERQGLQNLGPWMVAQNVTGIRMACSLLRAWLKSLPEDFKMPLLRVVHAGAESLYGSDVAMAARHLVGEWRIVHTLSSTETGMICGFSVRPHDKLGPGVLPVGYPIEGTEISLIEEPETQTPGVGEIAVRSPYISLGYWNEPELTAAAFAADPADSTLRTYRTGDLGRWRPDGSLEYLGRKTRKIKLSGYSVEPYEVENELLRITGLQDAVVVPHGSPMDRHLVAYIVASKATTPDSSSIRRHLAATLPNYMMPRHIVVMDAFPLTARGKVDIGALPPPTENNSQKVAHTASNPTQRGLATIWQDVLNLPEIDVDANFYDLGGTSLQAFLIFARIAQVLGRDLPPTLMLQAPTIAQQAELLTGEEKLRIEGNVVPFRVHGRKPPLFIVHGGFGDIMFAREIVCDVKSDRPIYGLQPPLLDGVHKLPHTMEAIAADYLSEVRKLQPKGPYFLAGYSFGGTVALEMAQQLARAGERVSFLGLIDTIYDSKYEVAGEAASARLGRHLHNLRSPGAFSYVAARAWETLSYKASRTTERLGNLPNELRWVAGRAVPYEKRAEFYRSVFSRANHRYRPQPYSGEITIFSAKDKTEWHRARWSSIAEGGLRIYEVPADHLAMVWPPHSKLLAQYFDAGLDQVQN